MSPVYSSPHSGSSTAVTAPGEIAAGREDGALWRYVRHGIEVVTLEKGVLVVRLIGHDGTAGSVEHVGPSFGYRSAKWVALAGGLIIATAGIAALLGVRGPAVALVGFGGWGVVVIAAAARALGNDLSSQAKKRAPAKEWHAPTNLGSWRPRTAAQLATVESLADDNDGLALVGDLGGSTIDVCVLRHGRLLRLWVDEFGNAGPQEGSDRPFNYYVDILLKALLGSVWVSFIAYGFAHEHGSAAPFLATLAATAILMLVGWLNDRGQSLHERVRATYGSGRAWTEIRTKVPDSD